MTVVDSSSCKWTTRQTKKIFGSEKTEMPRCCVTPLGNVLDFLKFLARSGLYSLRSPQIPGFTSPVRRTLGDHRLCFFCAVIAPATNPALASEVGACQQCQRSPRTWPYSNIEPQSLLEPLRQVVKFRRSWPLAESLLPYGNLMSMLSSNSDYV